MKRKKSILTYPTNRSKSLENQLMKLTKIFSLAVALNLIALAGFAQDLQKQHQLSEKRLERYEGFLQKEVDEGRIAGAVSL
ncbi:MAG: hypothetical protein ABJC55_07655, partial [Algoriphagus sp.]